MREWPGNCSPACLAVSQRFKLRLCDVASTSPARKHLEGLTRSLGCHVLVPQAPRIPQGNLIQLSLPDFWHYLTCYIPPASGC